MGEYICNKCGKQMYCEQNEVRLQVDDEHMYLTDRFVCHPCSVRILVIGAGQKMVPIEGLIRVVLNKGPVDTVKTIPLSDYVPEGLSDELQFTVAEGAEQWEVKEKGFGVAGLPMEFRKGADPEAAGLPFPKSYPKMPKVKPPREPGTPGKFEIRGDWFCVDGVKVWNHGGRYPNIDEMVGGGQEWLLEISVAHKQGDGRTELKHGPYGSRRAAEAIAEKLLAIWGNQLLETTFTPFSRDRPGKEEDSDVDGS